MANSKLCETARPAFFFFDFLKCETKLFGQWVALSATRSCFIWSSEKSTSSASCHLFATDKSSEYIYMDSHEVKNGCFQEC